MTAFDAAAAGYDSIFTRTTVGRWLRGRVWARLETHFRPGMRVLELACGTGEDALWLARRGVHVTATDASPTMLAAARRKVDAGRAGALVECRPLDLARLPEAAAGFDDGYDGALSDFGGLNCLGDWRPVAAFLARAVRPGGRVVLVVMGPWCPWEIAWHAAHGQPRTALRRLRRGGSEALVAGQPLRVWYPLPARLRRDFAPWFRPLGTYAIGSLLPPPYLSHLVDRWPRWFLSLGALERRVAGLPPFNVLNDHYLIEFERGAA